MTHAGDPAPPRTTDLSETGRLETFCDGVFAIAITLLVLEIRIPPAAGPGASPGHLWESLLSLWPSYFGYVISFLVIGIMWINHHAMFRYIRRTNRTFLLINVGFLLCISFVPFPTAVLAQHLRVPEDRVAALAFYSATILVIAIAFNVVWRYGVWNGRLLGPEADPAGIRTISSRYLLGPGLYAVALILAFVSVPACLAMHVGLAVVFAWPERS